VNLRDFENWFRDVTNDRAARRSADHLPELRAAFEELGFRQGGFLGEFNPPGDLWVYEVLSSPQADAFLTLALAPRGPLITKTRTIPTALLETAMEDGSIVITTT
jgi:hypothetical protein